MMLLASVVTLAAGCSAGGSGARTDLPPQKAAQASQQQFLDIKRAGPMPEPLSPRGTMSGRHASQDVPGNVEQIPMPIAASALASFPHTVPTTQATPAPTPTPRPEPTDKPCRSRCYLDRSRQNVVNTHDNGGQAGYILRQGSANGVGDLYVAMVALNNANMNPPADGSFNLLYGPTAHAPNGNCLEVSTDYYNGWGSNGTVSQVQLWDFCANGWAGAIPMNADFFNKYVRVYSNGNGMPQYIVEEAQGPDLKWHAYLYNNNNGMYDDIYQSAANVTTNVNNGDGWSIFETHYSTGTCSTIPTTGQSGLRTHNSNTPHQDWTYPGDYYTYSFGDCFPNGGTVSPYYQVTFAPTPDMAWTVSTY